MASVHTLIGSLVALAVFFGLVPALSALIRKGGSAGEATDLSFLICVLIVSAIAHFVAVKREINR